MKKELLKLYIDETHKLHKLEDILNNSLQNLYPDNSVFSVIPDSYRLMVSKLLQLTDSQENMLSWWMYEDTKGVEDKTGCMDLDSFDDFYSFVFENKTVAEIQSEKSGAVS